LEAFLICWVPSRCGTPRGIRPMTDSNSVVASLVRAVNPRTSWSKVRRTLVPSLVVCVSSALPSNLDRPAHRPHAIWFLTCSKHMQPFGRIHAEARPIGLIAAHGIQVDGLSASRTSDLRKSKAQIVLDDGASGHYPAPTLCKSGGRMADQPETIALVA